ncbi:MAG: hypothetical protein A2189_00495 [Paenibacillus sp. RIFOXYA1_FULL_44_5]|nr:MAG: hypothetical protein A2189_00495 [Paenibacillus sp. RIFOXYA1_FULL_44_5]
MTPRHKWAAFLLSFLPGVGHLYLGLNKRGLKFMIGTFFSISMIPVLPMIFPFVLTVIWFYALFDALQKTTWVNMHIALRSQKMMQPSDAFDESEWMSEPIQLQEDQAIDPLWLGGGSVLVGILIFIYSVFPNVWNLLIRMNLGHILMSLILIGFGLWILYKQFSKK